MEVEGRTRERDVQAPETRPERPRTPEGRPEAQGEDVAGVDAATDRPGVPMEADAGPPVALPGAPVAAADARPPTQPGSERHLRRAALEGPTPVVGTAQPPHGLSGFIRGKAYEVPERFARHWMLLLVADRVDVAEDRVGSALARPLDSLGMPGQAGYARRNPFGVLAWFAASVWLTKRVVSGRRV